MGEGGAGATRTHREWKTSAFRVAASLVLGSVVLFNLVRAIPYSVHAYAFPFWQLTYAHGFVRRGLIGTLFQWITPGVRLDDQRAVIVSLHSLAVAGLIAVVVFEARRLSRAGSPLTRFSIGVGTLALLLSRLVPTLGRLEGWFDVYLMLIAFIAARALDRGRLMAAIGLACVGPFVHDGFVVLWSAVVVLSLRPDGSSWRDRIRRRGIVLVPIAVALLVMIFHSDGAVDAEVAAMPIDPALKEDLRLRVFRPSFAALVMRVWVDHRDSWRHLLACAALFLTPLPLVLSLAVRLDPDPSRKRAVGVALLAAGAPYTINVVAWDLSRFLVWLLFAAMLVLFANAHAANERDVDRRCYRVEPLARAVAVAWLVVLAFLATGPHLGMWFGVGFGEYSLGPEIMRHAPASKLTYEILLLYDEKNAVRRWSMRDDCTVESGNATRLGGCSFLVRGRATLMSPFLRLPPGDYMARAVTRGHAACPDSGAKLRIESTYRFGPDKSFPLEVTTPGRIHFRLRVETAAMGLYRVVVEADEPCVVVEDVVLEQTRSH